MAPFRWASDEEGPAPGRHGLVGATRASARCSSRIVVSTWQSDSIRSRSCSSSPIPRHTPAVSNQRGLRTKQSRASARTSLSTGRPNSPHNTYATDSRCVARFRCSVTSERRSATRHRAREGSIPAGLGCHRATVAHDRGGSRIGQDGGGGRYPRTSEETMTTLITATDAVATDVVTLRVGTRKGAWTLAADSRDGRLEAVGTDDARPRHPARHGRPRDPSRVLIAARTGHLGPTVMRSSDGGATWTESTKPPAFEAGDVHRPGRAGGVLAHARPGRPARHVVRRGSPQGLFRTEDHGDTWSRSAGGTTTRTGRRGRSGPT